MLFTDNQGVEISTESTTGENIHVLGYFPVNMPQDNMARIHRQLAEIREKRYFRGKEMLRLLAGLGMPLEVLPHRYYLVCFGRFH